MKTELKKSERANYRVIVRDETDGDSISFPIYEEKLDITVLLDKLRQYVNKLQ